MRAIIGIAILLLVLAWVGWVQFSSPDGDPTIRVDAEKVRQDTSVIVEKSKQVLDDAAEKVGDASEEVDASPDLEPLEKEN